MVRVRMAGPLICERWAQQFAHDDELKFNRLHTDIRLAASIIVLNDNQHCQKKSTVYQMTEQSMANLAVRSVLGNM